MCHEGFTLKKTIFVSHLHGGCIILWDAFRNI